MGEGGKAEAKERPKPTQARLALPPIQSILQRADLAQPTQTSQTKKVPERESRARRLGYKQEACTPKLAQFELSWRELDRRCRPRH